RPKRAASRAPMAPPPPPMEPAPAMAEMADDAPIDFEDSVAEGMVAPASVSTRRPGAAAVGLDLFEAPPARGPVFHDPSLPAVVAGGLDYVYSSTTRVTVPSSPEQHTVPLSAEAYPVEPFYEASPALEPTAFLKATVKNRGDKPLLGGPVDIFVGADYVGSGQLETTGVGGDVQLPLGADEDIKFVRRLIPKTKTEGVFSKDDITGYTTEIDVVNHKRRAVSVRVVEQFPISDVEDLKIERGKLSLKASEGPDDTGIMAFQVELKPGEKKTIEFSYRIKRPANWKLYQR
ncbi:MAG: DUF4139 domain-containing protein, partial [Myxococcales bacterium]|nr:DUF4139 domain-containing protein [Myxococcales bacterium]